ncbi:MAG: glucokinase [Stutzerimonas stutzeri]
MKTALVGDIGGTNARFALWRDQRIEQIRVLPTADHARPELAIRAYLDERWASRWMRWKRYAWPVPGR